MKKILSVVVGLTVMLVSLALQYRSTHEDWRIEVVFGQRFAGDSVLACPIFRTASGKVGLMSPAEMIKWINDSTVVGVRREATTHCAAVLQQHGITLTTKEVKHVEKWSASFTFPPKQKA